MTDPNTLYPYMTAEALAELFHETYEYLSVEHGYKTRTATAVAWPEVPEPNRSLMIATAGEVLAALRGEIPEEDEVAQRALERDIRARFAEHFGGHAIAEHTDIPEEYGADLEEAQKALMEKHAAEHAAEHAERVRQVLANDPLYAKFFLGEGQAEATEEAKANFTKAFLQCFHPERLSGAKVRMAKAAAQVIRNRLKEGLPPPFNRFFVDLEFMEWGGGGEGGGRLISIGVAPENGKGYYAVNADADLSLANDWVKENVIPHLGPDSVYKPAAQIAADLKELFLPNGEDSPTPRLYTDYGAYDHVIMCWLFGMMVDLPEGMPMYTRDLRPFFEEHDIKDLDSNHNAMDDAYNLRMMWMDLMVKTCGYDGESPLAWF